MSSKKEKIHKVSWRLHNPHINYAAKKVKGTLFMPDALPNGHRGKLVGQPVMLDSHNVSESTTYALTIMRDSCSNNILKVKLVFKGKSDVVACVEPFNGYLYDYLKSKSLGISEFHTFQSKFTLPTPNLCSVIRQIIEGLEDLRKSGHYHGGFSLEKTYYFMDQSGVIVKLCNFTEKTEGSFKRKLAEDWWAVRDGLAEIRKIADELKSLYPKMDCCQLDGLIKLLNNIGPVNAESAFGIIRRQPFFWGKIERKEFFVCVIPLSSSKFWSDVDKAEEFISLPWGGGDELKGYLKIMNKYRVSVGLDEYDTNSRVDYVKFISGLYTHEAQLNLKLHCKLMVDMMVQARDPALCYKLYALKPDANTAGI